MFPPGVKGAFCRLAFHQLRVHIPEILSNWQCTFIKLLMRLYDTTEGQVLLSGENVKNLNLQAYRRLYGTAFQDYQVFSLSVAENVLMYKPQCEADYAKAEAALRRTGVYEKVCTLPHGCALQWQFFHRRQLQA